MAAVKSFSTAAGKDEPIVGESVDEADDESCAEESAIVEETICTNKSVGETENMVAADVKSCADETADKIVGANVDETGDESAVLESPIGIANDGLVDDNVTLAPPLLHGSCTDHGSTS